MLNLHSGGELISLADLAKVETPPATRTHVPLPHMDLVAMTKYALGFYQHSIVEEHYAIDKGGDRFFGILVLESDHGLYRDIVGLRNSADKTFPIGIAFGNSVMVCSNLSFWGDHVIKRKHTPGAKRELPGLIAEVIEPLHEARAAQAKALSHYQQVQLTNQAADHAILNMWREGCINLTQIDDVVHQWEHPEHDWIQGSAFHLLNAATFVLTGRICENPTITTRLHRVIDGVCEAVN